MLSDELSKCLTQPSLERFHAIQAECEAKQMSPLEMYVYLTARYEELLQAEGEAVRMIAKSLIDTDPSAASPPKEKIRAAQKQKKLNKFNTVTPQIIDGFPITPPLTRKQSNLEEEFLSKEICDEMEALQDDIEVRPVYDPYIESVVGKVFNVVDDPQLQSVVNMMLNGGDSRSSQNNFVIGSAFVNQEEGGTLECIVCRMTFESRKALDMHLGHSPIHSVNMKIRQQIFQNTLTEAERLAKLAQQTVNKFHAHDSNHPSEGPEVTAKARWRKAVNKVICNRLKQQFLPLVEHMCETPSGVKMLYAGSKYFYKSRCTFDLHIYLHISADTIEIVPHFLPSSKKQKSRHHSIEAFPRIFLDYKVLVQLVLGVDMSESRLSMKSTNVPSSIEPVSNNLVSAVTSKVVAMTSVKTETDSGLNKTIEQALTSYILNRLRALHDVKTHEYRMTFDIHGIQNSPLLDEPPLNVAPVPLSVEKIRLQYERDLHNGVTPEMTKRSMEIPSTNIKLPEHQEEESV